MWEEFAHVFARSTKTKIWLSLAIVLPLVVLLFGHTALSSADSDGFLPRLVARTALRVDWTAFLILVAALVQAIRCFRRDWKRFLD
jgi:hypothetical protein